MNALTAGFWGFVGGASLLVGAAVGLITTIGFLAAFALSRLE